MMRDGADAYGVKAPAAGAWLHPRYFSLLSNLKLP
jgi:hypothetical protein